MTLSGIITFIIVVLVLYYIGMIIWDQYTDKLSQNQKITTKEEEIDITSAFGGNEPSTIEIEEPTQEPRTQQQKQSITKTPFPWTVDKFCAEVEKLVLGEECKELDDVLVMTNNQLKALI